MHQTLQTFLDASTFYRPEIHTNYSNASGVNLIFWQGLNSHKTLTTVPTIAAATTGNSWQDGGENRR